MRRRRLVLAVGLALTVLAGGGPHFLAAMAEDGEWLTGQVLIASPDMADPRFAGTVIYMIDHDPGGAMGLVINRAYGRGRLAVLLETFGFDAGIVEQAGDAEVQLSYGGPVEPHRGFVLHSADFTGAHTQTVAGDVAVSVGRDVFEAILGGSGPEQYRYFIGYAGWGPGQLEREITRDDWLTAPGERIPVFTDRLEEIRDRALEAAGLTL